MLQELAPCYAGGGCGGSAFSLLFPVAGGQFEEAGSVVDCTLSLGTPSTRRAEARVGVGGKESTPAARRCANCDTTSTPLWRNGPRGPKSLCNACGIRYKKEERRAAAATTQDAGLVGSYACGAYARQQQHQPQQWACYGGSSASYGYGETAGADGPCLSWMLNVMPSSPAFAVRERPTLFQYY